MVVAAPEHETSTGWVLLSQNPGQHEASSLTIAHWPCLIGRSVEATVRLAHPTVSGRHAELAPGAGGGLALRDLGSTNGTFVNGQRVLDSRDVGSADLLQFGEMAYRLLHKPRSSNSCTQVSSDVDDLALALTQLERLFESRAVVPHYQPIVRGDSRETIAYEVLARTRLFGLQQPSMMFKAAAYLDREQELSRLLRDVSVIRPASGPPPHLFLNTHPTELRNPAELIQSLRKLRAAHREHPMTLEIHEAAVVDVTTLKVLRLALEDMQIGLAFDDFGAGQARLMELVEARPDMLKLDMKLVRDIHEAPASRQQLLKSVVRIARELGIKTIAEGVENPAEVLTCRQMGVDLFQGYHFGRPAEAGVYFG